MKNLHKGMCCMLSCFSRVSGGGNPGMRTRAESGTLGPSLVQRYEAELKQPEREQGAFQTPVPGRIHM